MEKRVFFDWIFLLIIKAFLSTYRIKLSMFEIINNSDNNK